MVEKVVVQLDNVFLKSNRGGQVFCDLCLRVEAGRSAVVIGAAGSGKSTMVELLVGRRFADSGSVEVFGEILKPRKKRRIKRTRKKIGGVGGIFGLVPSFTVAENILFPLVLTREKRKVRKERLLKMLTEFSLLRLAGERPANLTRVESTLVQFARASIANQPLVIIDEPLAGLDQKTYHRIFEYLIRLSLSGRSMLILSSESLPEKIPNSDCYRLENGALM